MPRLINATPKYRHHKGSGQAVVTLSGRDYYLGPWNSQASRREFDRLVAEWILNGRKPLVSEAEALVVAKIAAAYLAYASDEIYLDRETGKLSRAVYRVRAAADLLIELYGEIDAVVFGPLALKEIQRRLAAEGKSRSYVNQMCECVKRMFKWAASEQKLPVEVYQALRTVDGLRKGRSAAREPAPVKPVDNAIVEATLPYLPAIPAAMVNLQRLTGARPGEICIMRPADVDRSGETWAYRPQRHKTEHHDKQRVIFIGPKAQAILLPYLLRDAEAFCFSPRESRERIYAERRENRKSPLTPSQRRRRPKRKPKRAPGQHYTTGSYAKAIDRAADKALGKVCGPFSAAKLVELINAGALSPRDVVRLGDRAPWKTVAASSKRLAAAAAKGAKSKTAPPDQWQWMSTRHRWSPNQLRHAAETEIRRKHGLEAAQVILGHSKADVTQIYAERDMAKAAAVIREVG